MRVGSVQAEPMVMGSNAKAMRTGSASTCSAKVADSAVADTALEPACEQAEPAHLRDTGRGVNFG